MKYQAVKGMDDILPSDARVWQEFERLARIELESNGYEEIRTPVLEETAVFVRGLGETTDIVTKEMFTFEDRKGRSLTLRPEGTAPIARSYIEHSLNQVSSVLRLYYIGPMFRAERPQKGRSRQFHQIGIEIIGSRSVQLDFEAVWRLDKLLHLFGLKDYVIKINNLGCATDKSKFAEVLKDYLKNEKSKLCEDCRARMEKNVMRVLDCKKEGCIQVVSNAPDIAGNLCKGCADNYALLKAMLQGQGMGFQEAPRLVRGLDYYTGNVFEVTHPELGGQDALAAGGRYDNLIRDMGGPDTGAVGFALGMERAIIALGDGKGAFRKPYVIYIATLGHEAKMEGFRLAERLRERLNKDRFIVKTLIDLEESSLKSQLRSADKNGAGLVIILGEDELKQGMAGIKDMEKKVPQVLVRMDSVFDEVERRLGIC